MSAVDSPQNLASFLFVLVEVIWESYSLAARIAVHVIGIVWGILCDAAIACGWPLTTWTSNLIGLAVIAIYLYNAIEDEDRRELRALLKIPG
jgi:hypothetical protein